MEAKLSEDRLITADMLKPLPMPVQRYMTFSGVLGKPWIKSVILWQVGRFRLGRDKPWMPVRAEQRYSTEPPAFIWNARFSIGGLPLISGRDTYQAGHGHMRGKVAGLVTLFDARGPELDQGAMLRYMNEMVWFPTAFLGQNIRWRDLDDHSAEVTFVDGVQSVSAQMFFDDAGRPTNFRAMRYRENGGRYTLDPWSTPFSDYGVHGGLNLPVRGRGVWHLPDGDFPYVELRISRIEYNRATDPF